MPEPSTYPAGLRLAGRRVVVVGGGHVSQRRVPALIAAGADVLVVAPEVTAAVEGMAGAGELTWRAGRFEETDLDDAWYVIAATDDVQVNREVGAACEERRIFCVRADSAHAGTAWTPATGHHDGLTVAVLGNREPRRSVALRDAIMAAVLAGLVDVEGVGDVGDAPVRTAGVVLVGGGPGHPDLISVAGRRALLEADVVVADRLAPRELLGDLRPEVELLDVSKLPRGRSATQEDINTLLVGHALAGKRVVRFKGGDSFVFGRGYEEILACREAGVPVRVIPGLTSPVAVPALVGIPVTHRGVAHDFTVISGHLPPDHPESLTHWASVAGLRGTLVLMMAVHHAPAISAVLVAGGRASSTPVAVICDGSMPGERTVLSTLGDLGADLERHGVRPPAVIVVGDVVAVAHPEHYR